MCEVQCLQLQLSRAPSYSCSYIVRDCSLENNHQVPINLGTNEYAGETGPTIGPRDAETQVNLELFRGISRHRDTRTGA